VRITALLSAAIGCTTLACVHLPPTPPDMTRELLRPGASTTCTPNRCTGSVMVGERRYGVETRIDARPLEHALAGTRPSLAQRAVGAVADDVMVRISGMTEHVEASLVRRTVRPRDGGPVLICDAVWIDVEVRQRHEPEMSRSRIGEGQSCTVSATGDPADATWRFRAGSSTAPDSLRETYGHLVDYAGRGLTRERVPMWLERITTAEAAQAYEVRFDGYISAGNAIRGWRARVERDSVDIARFHLVEEHGRSAVDFHPGLSDDERELLRLLAAHLLITHP
jgi:hypothetical protein